jgi:hypothetical protein
MIVLALLALIVAMLAIKLVAVALIWRRMDRIQDQLDRIEQIANGTRRDLGVTPPSEAPPTGGFVKSGWRR